MRVSMCTLASGIVLGGELIRIDTAKVLSRHAQIGPRCSAGAAQREAARGRDHGRA
jgi:hypothetical protein